MKFITKLEGYFVVIFLALLILLVFLAAALRWFGISVAWSVDAAQMLFAWVCFIGADLALRQDKHVGLDMFVIFLPGKIRNGLALVVNLLMLAFCALVVVYGTRLCIQNYRRFFNTLPISYSLVTAAGPVGCFLLCTTILRRIWMNIRNFINNDFSQINYAETGINSEQTGQSESGV